MNYYNLYPSYLYNCPFPIFFKSVDELYLKDIPKEREWNNIIDRDPYINKYKNNKVYLALDIIESGSYWPIFVYEEKRKLFVTEGIHRVEQLKTINTNKRFMVIKIPKDIINVDNRLLDKSIRNLRTIKEVSLFIPFFRHQKLNCFESRFLKQLNYEKVKSNIYKVNVANEYVYYKCFKVYHNIMRHYLFYKKIKPFDIINDEVKWKEFKRIC